MSSEAVGQGFGGLLTSEYPGGGGGGRFLGGVFSTAVDGDKDGTFTAAEFVKEWTVDELVPLVEQGIAARKRDFNNGRRAYGAVACGACHRFAQDGGLVGPDLTTVSGRFGVRDLLESIVEPNKAISDQYAMIRIFKKDGDIVSGRIANLSGSGVSVVENMFDPGNMTNVNRADIDSMELSEISMMPQGLLNSLSAGDIQDLVAFLLSQGDSEHAVFQ